MSEIEALIAGAVAALYLVDTYLHRRDIKELQDELDDLRFDIWSVHSRLSAEIKGRP